MTTFSSHAATTSAEAAKTRRIELILRQIDALPTLPAIATRLLALTTDEQSEASQVIELIQADQALTARLLSICRKAEMGIREEAATIDKAVVLLGFTAVRNAVLSLKVYDMFADAPVAEGATIAFDRRGFWRHSLAVALAAEALAQGVRDAELDPGSAFVAGLLHDLGKLALDFVLPKSFARVIELVDLNQGNIAEFERRIIGIDHHTAGKRLAEQWNLPHFIQDAIWLHGCPFEMLPKLDHRRMIGLISLADLLVRRSHLGYSGNFVMNEDETALAAALGLPSQLIPQVSANLHTSLEARCRTLGLDEEPSRELFLQSIQQANQMLGRLNLALERRGRVAQRQAQILDAIIDFHAAALPGRSVEDVLRQVVHSATATLGSGYYALVYQAGPGDPWLVSPFNAEGNPTRSQLIAPPSSCPDLARLDAGQPAALNVMGIMPLIADALPDAPDLRELRVLPLGCGWGTAALLLHDRPILPPWNQLQALAHTWGATIAAIGQHDGARRLGEELAQANRALAEAQDHLLHSEAMARLGEMAAGAAHEMNNPLAVISGRAQLLTQMLPRDSKENQAAATIVEQAHRLSEMISLMRLVASTPHADRQPTSLRPVLEEAVEQAQARCAGPEAHQEVQLHLPEQPLVVSIDGPQITAAVTELVHNALTAKSRTGVTVRTRLEAGGRLLVIEVKDDGVGMDAHTLAHALDPFFSNQPAGRRPGMGLPKAKILVGAHNGRIELRSQPQQGTTATLLIPLDSPA